MVTHLRSSLRNRVILIMLAIGLVALRPSDGLAQVPSAAEAERLLQENPELVRQRLVESGLSEAEIRARLGAMGFPSDRLDALMAGEDLGSSSAGAGATLSGLETLGAVQSADGLELVESMSGMQSERLPDSRDRGFPIFGHDVFRRATSQFQPLLSGPVSDDYQLGPGDRILLILTGEAELAHELGVTRDGAVIVPQVGRISVANLTMAELRTLFRDRFAGFYSGIRRGTTSINVTITEIRTIQIYVTGEIEQPGAYQLSSVATVTNALYAAAGPTDLGNLRQVRISRRDGENSSLDLYPYLLEGDVTGDITLEQGDVLFVPPRERRVQLHGAVGRPAQYEITESEDLIDLLRAGSGFGPRANRSRVTVYRILRPSDRASGLGSRLAIDLDLTASEDPSAVNHLDGVIIPPVGLQDGDSIVVSSVAALEQSFHVTVRGMVAEPNMFPWHEGMTLRELVNLARGPIVGADLREAAVSRLPKNRKGGELASRLLVPLDSSYLSPRSLDARYVGPAGIDFPAPGTAPVFTLDPFDQVVILRQPEFEMPQSVTITGEVAVPGVYTLLSKNDRILDLIARAGSVLTNGNLDGAQLIRNENDLGRVDLNLSAAMIDPLGSENVLLRPGDLLNVPVYSPTVVVNGAVNSPVTVLYREGRDFQYYIEAAGGFRADADKKRSSVQSANGLTQIRSKFLLWSSYPSPTAGGVITVPAKDPSDKLDKVALTTGLVSVLGSLATIFIVIVSNSSPN
jgi:protein involved in polysaccharide export with SLBB domain